MSTLSESQLKQFEEEGWLLVEGLLNPETVLDPIIEEYHGVLDDLAHKLHTEGKIESTYEELEFSERLIRISEETREIYTRHFDFTLPQGNIKPDTPIWTGPAIFNVLRNPQILDVAEDIIGPEIWSNPVQHVRMKLPEDRTIVSEDGKPKEFITPWHQDNGVVREEADETEMLTVWFPLWDAPVESGCLSIIPRSTEKGLRTHCTGRGPLTIPEQILETEKERPMPMKRGDVLFLHRHTCHKALPNQSKRVRWSLDLRYNPTGQPTGRDVFPGFVARSRANPDAELRDAKRWSQMWMETRAKLADKELEPFNRWNSTAEVCA